MPVEWLPVPDFEGLYEVSNTGLVRSLPRWARCKNSSQQLRPGRILKPYIEQRPGHLGYRRVTLAKDGEKIRKFVHQIVAEAFIGPCPPGEQVRHGPSGVDDNGVDNLSYGTAQENAMD